MASSTPSSVLTYLWQPTSTAVLLLILTTSLLFVRLTEAHSNSHFPIQEATINDIQKAFHNKELTSRQLVKFYMNRIKELNPTLRGVIEVNPDALAQADKADRERKKKANLGALHGIPVLLKDNIATKDKLNTTAGSYALLGSVVPRDAGVAFKLRKAGAVILGKASLSEWADFRSVAAPNGWSARGGQGHNPYNISTDPCGSSSGSAISVAANIAAVSLGTETDGSILCPASSNSVVGIKPTVGLTSRGGVIPITPRQDTVGQSSFSTKSVIFQHPSLDYFRSDYYYYYVLSCYADTLDWSSPICRTVADAVYVLDAIVGFDPYDAQATRNALKYIPAGGYAQFLKIGGIRGKRLGIVRNPFFKFTKGSAEGPAFKKHLQTLRRRGAVLIDNLEIANIDTILAASGEIQAMLVEFKLALNSYLKGLVSSPVRTLSDVIAFNERSKDLEMIKQYGQEIFLAAEATNGIDANTKKALVKLAKLTKNGFEKIMKENKLDAVLTPGADFATILAIGGYPGINVPAGYKHDGQPFGICFGGLKGYEPRLIQIAYDFEQATKIRKPPCLAFLRPPQPQS